MIVGWKFAQRSFRGFHRQNSKLDRLVLTFQQWATSGGDPHTRLKAAGMNGSSLSRGAHLKDSVYIRPLRWIASSIIQGVNRMLFQGERNLTFSKTPLPKKRKVPIRRCTRMPQGIRISRPIRNRENCWQPRGAFEASQLSSRVIGSGQAYIR